MTGRLALKCGGSDRKVDYSYDPAGQLLEAAVTNPHGTDLDRRSYTYGNRGERLTETTEHGTTTVETVYGFDDALQLLSSDPDDAAATTYTYDQAGRRVARTSPTGTTSYLYDTRGLLEGVGTVDVPYDPLGYRSGTTFYDYSGRQAYPTVSMAGTTTSSFRFDWGDGFIGVGVNDETATIFTYGHDPYGTTTEHIDTAAAARYYTGPFGDHASGPDPIMYRGDLTTTDTDLDYLRNRYYDPDTATFTTQDPLDGVEGTPTVTNPYHYVDNDPLNKVDPLGLRPRESDFVSYGIGDCPPVFFDFYETTPGSPQYGIATFGSACQRGRAVSRLIELGSVIRPVAAAAGITPRLLAATLLHEGAAILRGGLSGELARLTHAAKNYNEVVHARDGSPSSGIGQLQAQAARKGLGWVGVSVDGYSDFDVLTGLTFNDRFSVTAAGGYLGFLNNEDNAAGGRATDRDLFLMYSLNPAARFLYRSARYNVEALEASGRLSRPGVLRDRVASWVRVDRAARAAGF